MQNKKEWTEEQNRAFHLLWNDLRSGIWEQETGEVLNREDKKKDKISDKKKT